MINLSHSFVNSLNSILNNNIKVTILVCLIDLSVCDRMLLDAKAITLDVELILAFDRMLSRFSRVARLRYCISSLGSFC